MSLVKLQENFEANLKVLNLQRPRRIMMPKVRSRTCWTFSPSVPSLLLSRQYFKASNLDECILPRKESQLSDFSDRCMNLFQYPVKVHSQFTSVHAIPFVLIPVFIDTVHYPLQVINKKQKTWLSSTLCITSPTSEMIYVQVTEGISAIHKSCFIWKLFGIGAVCLFCIYTTEHMEEKIYHSGHITK